MLPLALTEQTDEVPTGRRRDKGLDGAAGNETAGGGQGGGKGAAADGGGDGEGEGLESTLGRIGDRTVNSVAKLRKSDRFKSQMVRERWVFCTVFVRWAAGGKGVRPFEVLAGW